MSVLPIVGTDDPETLLGTTGSETISGLGGNDTIDANDGNDTVLGGSGDDRIEGGYGNDRLFGGDGDDRIECEYGADWLYGGAGNDSFALYSFSGLGRDRVYGGADDDRLFASELVNGLYDGGTGVDAFTLFWYDVDDPVSGSVATGFSDGTVSWTLIGVERLDITVGNGDDTIAGGDGSDQISVLGGANTVDAGAGSDSVFYAAGMANILDGGDGNDRLLVVSHDTIAGGGFTFDASGVDATDGFGSILANFERFLVSGTSYADTLTGGARRDRLDGRDGDDLLSGMHGDDRLLGLDDNDDLRGGAGNDTLIGGAGQDTLNGGDGADTFILRQTGQGDVIEDFSATQGDRIAIRSGVTGGLLDPGPLQTGDLVYGSPGAGNPVFVLVSDGPDGPSQLFWDADGGGVGAAELLVTILGPPDVVADAIFLY